MLIVTGTVSSLTEVTDVDNIHTPVVQQHSTTSDIHADHVYLMYIVLLLLRSS